MQLYEKPTEYTQEIGEAFCDEVAGGTPITELCSKEEYPDEKTFRHWLAFETEFKQQYWAAKELLSEKIYADMQEIERKMQLPAKIQLTNDAGEPEFNLKTGNPIFIPNPDHIGFNGRALLASLQWRAEKANSDKYGAKSTVQVEGIDLKEKIDEARKRLQAQKNSARTSKSK